MIKLGFACAFLAILAIAPILCVQKEPIKEDEIKIVEIEDDSFFNAAYIESNDFLVLVIPDMCKECEELMKEFEKEKKKLVEEFPDILIGYVHGRHNDNMLVRRALGIKTRPSSLVVKAFVKNQLHTYEGRINIKRLSKWMNGISEGALMDNRMPPSGVIQVDSAMLHYLSKETSGEINLLLAPADTYFRDKRFVESLEKTQTHFGEKGLKICIGLVETEVSLSEVGGFGKKSQIQNLVYIQKLTSGAMFTIVKEEKEEEIPTEKNVIEWIKLNHVPKMANIEKRAELKAVIKDNDYLILGYSRPGNSSAAISLAQAIGKLAQQTKSFLISEHSKSYTEIFFERIKFALTTNRMIADKFELAGTKQAVIAIFNDESTVYDNKVYVPLAREEEEDDGDALAIESMMSSLKDIFLGDREKDEL